MKNNGIFKCALFDLDGVVFNTEPQYTKFWGGVFKTYQPSCPGNENDVKGMTLLQIFDKYFHGQEKTQQNIIHKLDAFEANMDFDYVNGFEKFVLDLRKNGINTAVVTSSNNVKMASVYEKRPEMTCFFDKILTSEDFERSKPDPDCYKKGAQKFGCTTSESIVFEDSFNGLKAGVESGAFVFGLATTNTRQAIEHFCDYVLDDYDGMSYDKICSVIKRNHKH